MTGMEDVLAEHSQHYTAAPYTVCSCDMKMRTGSAYAVHVAEALTAAGFGNLHDAWAEGYGIGGVDTILDLANGGAKDTPNPYTAPKVSET